MENLLEVQQLNKSYKNSEFSLLTSHSLLNLAR